MPCPFFEPLAPADEPKFRNGRIPLIEEHAGTCHASADLPAVKGATCNTATRSDNVTAPAIGPSAAMRYSILGRCGGALEVLCITEENYSPAGTRRLHFLLASDRLEETDVDLCMAAQACAFCRAYLRVVATTRIQVAIRTNEATLGAES